MTDATLVVTFMNGPADGRWVTAHNPAVRIGRAPDNDVVIDFDPKVADTHLVIERQPGGWRMVDRSAGGGVRIDGLPIRQREALQSGQLVSVGDTLLRISVADRN